MCCQMQAGNSLFNVLQIEFTNYNMCILFEVVNYRGGSQLLWDSHAHHHLFYHLNECLKQN